ncbi:hypothetical protein CIL05_18655 [Virgibacillus profundi]|uniref:DUF1648 domain-containing protein n=1 Tax=Virgibacillus profundi TaxID=2024555 RepID=A0A2A2I9S5_9BACI|nr:DUF5808 domain-containing protein [Virgibacillus profundi]PAV28128.1 hypothetical protein CIL05_18655 [Virgibacillus profundi]PXY52433.1 DUF1648 domain-containing protein [Virgibacillus profundi]
MNITIVLLVVILIPVFVSLMFIPYWTRKTESFGVSIPGEVYHSPVLKAMRKQYALMTGNLSILVMGIFLLFGFFIENDENTISILFGIIIAVYIISSFLIYLKFHGNMKALKVKENWAKEKSQQVFIDMHFREQKITYSNLWFIFSFIIAFATIALTFQSYHQIPDRIPMQYNFQGEVTNWADKSYRSVLIMPIMQLYLTLLFIFINTIIAKAKQQINAEKPEESVRRNIIFRRRWSLYIIITGTALTLMFSFIQLSFIYPINQQLLTIVPLVFSLAVTLGAIILSITTGQGGSRVKTSTGENGDIIDRDDDKYWKLGQFYFNKNDPALFLEKRFGVGWTINFARPLAWIIFVAIILLAVGIPILLGA